MELRQEDVDIVQQDDYIFLHCPGGTLPEANLVCIGIAASNSPSVYIVSRKVDLHRIRFRRCSWCATITSRPTSSPQIG